MNNEDQTEQNECSFCKKLKLTSSSVFTKEALSSDAFVRSESDVSEINCQEEGRFGVDD